MNVEYFRDFCLSLPHVTEHFPFDDVILVFKVANSKLFALLPLDDGDRANVKCDPEKAIELREQFSAVKPGFHMNKKHWNTIFFHEDADDQLILEWVKHSYNLVYQSLPRRIKKEFPLEKLL